MNHVSLWMIHYALERIEQFNGWHIAETSARRECKAKNGTVDCECIQQSFFLQSRLAFTAVLLVLLGKFFYSV